MPGFIHGEVSWVESADSIRANVAEMLGAVDHFPWRGRASVMFNSPSSTGAMAAQHSDSRTAQFVEEAEDLTVVVDLQLHRRAELASRLHASGEDPDAAFVARAYRRLGLEFADHVIGEGVIAIWDTRAQRLLLWRDAAGARPIYYRHNPGKSFVFSSDLLAMNAHPHSNSRIDLAYASAFLRDELFQHPTRTMVEGIHKVPAAHVLVVEDGHVGLRRYWDPRTAGNDKVTNDDEAIEELLDLLENAVADRVNLAGSHVASHLSGGLDSSGLAVFASNQLKEMGRELDGFSWAPPRDVVESLDRDERNLVDAVAKYAGFNAHYTELRPRDIVDFAYRDVALRPRATLNFEIATSRNAVDRGARTIISGWGGDEMIALNGRGYFSDLARRGRLLEVGRELSLRAGIQGGSLLGAWKSKVFMPLAPDWIMNRRPDAPRPLPAELRPDFARELMAADPLPFEFPRERPGVHRMQADLVDFGHLQFRMESWAAHGATLGLAYTFPLLDRRVMDFAMSLPGRMFFRDGWKRWLFRTAMKGKLPEEVRWNPKKYDDAAGTHLRRVLFEPADMYRDLLLRHVDNPLVDVQMIIDEQTRRFESRAGPGDVAPDVDRNVGGGTWLAFTALRPS